MCIGLKKWVLLIRAQGAKRRKVNPGEGGEWNVVENTIWGSGSVSQVCGIVACGSASPRFAAKALIARQLYPAGRSRGATLAQYVMGCMLGAPGGVFSRRGKFG
jgi:hypothetical protein